MTATIIECEQGSEAWLLARMGIPTASEFHTIMAKGKDGASSISRRTYMLKLAGEIITEQPMETYTNQHMERGKMLEAEARALYAFHTDYDPRLVGFVRNGSTGCSPDALINNDGVLEIKTALPHILASHILNGEFPPDHRAQCQGALWITGRDWVDIAIYWPRMPMFRKRAYREDGYIATIAGAVNAFNEELAVIVEKIRNYEQPYRNNLLMAG